MSKRIVVTGRGCVTPVGHSPQAVWKSVTEGRSGIVPISRFDARNFPTTFAAEVRDFDSADWLKPDVIKHLTGAGIHLHYGVAAAVDAMKEAGLEAGNFKDPTRVGVYLGAGEGPQDFDVFMDMITRSRNESGEWDMDLFTEMALHRLSAAEEEYQEPNYLSALIARQFGTEGSCSNCLTACAASAQSIGEGTEIIRSGDADIMIVGGSHCMLNPYGLTGFSLLTALSRRNDNPAAASRPFDNERDGFVLGEGAAILVLEEYEHARQRGAMIFGEICGYGVSCDAYRITDIPPDGNGLARAMKMALENARLNPEDISYVNAHGTSTGANDRTETLALKTAFGERAYQLPMSSTKSMTGHLVSACGGLEAIFSMAAMKDQVAPPTTNYEFPDPDCDLDYIPNQARPMPVKYVMSNNSGFGGQNVSLIFGTV